MHLTCLAIVGYALAAAAAAEPGGKPADDRPKVESFLVDHDVPSAAQLRALSRTPEKPLQAIAADARAQKLVRARAVAALRMFPSSSTRIFLGNLLEAKAETHDATERLLVRRAAIALGWLAAPDVCEQLALLFANQDVEVRVDAAIGLGLTRAPEAPAHLRRQLAVETDVRVRDQIERQLRALPQPPPPPPKKPPQRQPMRGGF